MYDNFKLSLLPENHAKHMWKRGIAAAKIEVRLAVGTKYWDKQKMHKGTTDTGFVSSCVHATIHLHVHITCVCPSYSPPLVHLFLPRHAHTDARMHTRTCSMRACMHGRTLGCKHAQTHKHACQFINQWSIYSFVRPSVRESICP